MPHHPCPTKEARIVIVGASLLGLSTALHLLSRGYRSITLLDRDPDPAPPPSSTAPQAKHAPLHYTSQYHALSLSALKTWAQWNEILWSSRSTSNDDNDNTGGARLWINNGFYTFFPSNSDSSLTNIPEIELERIAYLERRHGLKLALLASSDPDHVDSATSRMFCIDPFRLSPRGDNGQASGGGVLDTLGGTILVDQAWNFAVNKVKAALSDIKVVFDETAGSVDRVLLSSDSLEGKDNKNTKRTKGVQTKDGKTHDADLVIWACNPSRACLDSILMPPYLPEATQSLAETVIEVQISPDKHQDLWDRLSEDNFPSWAHTLASVPNSNHADDCEILSGFPRDDQGIVRILWRGPSSAVAMNSQQKIQEFLAKYLPDLFALLGHNTITTIDKTNTTHHYTESRPIIVNRAIVDCPPSTSNVLLAVDQKAPLKSFMFLPVIGAAVVDVLEGKPHAVKGWRWPVDSVPSSTSMRSSRL